ncbi:MAG TPA: dihydrofolate reductase family protein [Bellilinea sp.]|nr:dihydrofolate reductase family protein [Bellilinea sp.]
MRKLIVLEHISLDGVIQAPGGTDEDSSGGFTHGGWTSPYSDAALGTALRKKMSQPFDLLLGRKTYDIWAPYWPNHGEFWPQANSATKYVASRTLTAGSWGPVNLLSGDIPAQVRKIKSDIGPDLHIWGSADFLRTLIKHDLIDTYWLMVYPLTLGSGKKLFQSEFPPRQFQPESPIYCESGVVIMEYNRQRSD